MCPDQSSNDARAPQSSASRGAVSKNLGKYELRALLGTGSMGAVYRGFDPLLEREVAIKIISAKKYDSEVVERFEREARILAKILHPNLVVVYDLGHDETNGPFIVMELLEGRDLEALIRAGLRLFDKLDIVLQVCRGLSRAHAGGVVHRDIKPSNLFVTDQHVVKVMDFGVARLIQSDYTKTGVVLGTPAYMAPEQLMGERVDNRADLYSLGVILYRLLNERLPFVGADLYSLFASILHAEPPRITAVVPFVPELQKIVDRLLAKEPAARYQSADEVVEKLEGWLERCRRTLSESELDMLLFEDRSELPTMVRGEVDEGSLSPSLETAPGVESSPKRPRSRKLASMWPLWSAGVVVLCGFLAWSAYRGRLDSAEEHTRNILRQTPIEGTRDIESPGSDQDTIETLAQNPRRGSGEAGAGATSGNEVLTRLQRPRERPAAEVPASSAEEAVGTVATQEPSRLVSQEADTAPGSSPPEPEKEDKFRREVEALRAIGPDSSPHTEEAPERVLDATVTRRGEAVRREASVALRDTASPEVRDESRVLPRLLMSKTEYNLTSSASRTAPEGFAAGGPQVKEGSRDDVRPAEIVIKIEPPVPASGQSYTLTLTLLNQSNRTIQVRRLERMMSYLGDELVSEALSIDAPRVPPHDTVRLYETVGQWHEVPGNMEFVLTLVGGARLTKIIRWW